MKKPVLTVLLAYITQFGFAQAPIDFEDGGNGANLTWTTFENTNTNPPVEFIDNPSKTDINTTNKVAKFTVMKDGAPWAGATGTVATPIYFGETTRVINMMVWKSVISDVGVKLETPSTWLNLK